MYSGYICALMFCALLLRDFKQYAVLESMQCNLRTVQKHSTR